MRALFVFLLLAANSLVSCHSDALLEPELPDYSIVQGDTVKTRADKFSNFKGHPLYSRFIITGDTASTYGRVSISKPSQVINLKNIENPNRKGKPFRMVVFGGSLGAGVRDGGLFNEGMETSFGSLLANQMGIEFKNPLFDSDDYNGFGKIEATTYNPTKGPIPKFKQVINNTGIDVTQKGPNGDVVLKRTRVKYDNYSFPYGSTITKGEQYHSSTNQYISPFVERLDYNNLSREIKNGNTFDFFIIEIPEIDTYSMFFLSQFKTGEEFRKFLDSRQIFDNDNLMKGPMTTQDNYYYNFFKKIQNVGARGVIFNQPNVYDLPFYKQNYKSDFLKTLNTYQLSINDLSWIGLNGETKLSYELPDVVEGIMNADGIFGYSSLDSLISPIVNVNLKPGIRKNSKVELGVLQKTRIDAMVAERQENNESLKRVIAEGLGYAVVDIFNLYRSISEGKYVTHDGVKVSSDWPQGNFFSSDGIHPSAFGQAVITNEIIKVINTYYKIEIPLISTQNFLK